MEVLARSKNKFKLNPRFLTVTSSYLNGGTCKQRISCFIVSFFLFFFVVFKRVTVKTSSAIRDLLLI